MMASLVLALLLALPAAAAPEPSLSDLEWLAGSWAGHQGETEMEEHWTTPAGGMMVGMHRDLRPDGSAFFEFLRIVETDEGIAYLAMPAGRNPPTSFPLLAMEHQKVVFENPAHDFPQRILYWLDDADVLHARIEGTEDGENHGVEWIYRRQAAD